MSKEINVADYSAMTGLSRKTIYGKINKGKLSAVERREEDSNRPIKYIILDNRAKALIKKELVEVEQEEEIKGIDEEQENEVNNPVNEVIDEVKSRVNLVIDEVKEVNDPVNLNKEQEEQEQKPESKETTTTEKLLLQEIQDLREQIKEKDKQLLEFANKFAELAKQSNMIAEKAINTTGQAQILQAVDKQIKVNDAIEEPEERIGYKEPENEEEPKGFWKKLAYWFTH